MKREQLFVSSIASDCCAAARQYHVGIELAQYCTAARLDGAPADAWETPVEECLASAERFVFHGPFNELTPAAIDPLVLDVTKKRYRQAVARAGTGHQQNRPPRGLSAAGLLPGVVPFAQSGVLAGLCTGDPGRHDRVP